MGLRVADPSDVYQVCVLHLAISIIDDDDRDDDDDDDDLWRCQVMQAVPIAHPPSLPSGPKLLHIHHTFLSFPSSSFL